MKIVSGGQTGVDRAALDVALELGVAHGGWCPKGRRAEDGPIPARYQLVETASADYAFRTERNVLDSDATLIVVRGEPTRGTALTIRLAELHKRPLLRVDADNPEASERVASWLQKHRFVVLNVAGPRESQSPGIGEAAQRLLRAALGHYRP